MHISITDKVMTFPEQTENKVSEFAHKCVKVIPGTELTEKWVNAPSLPRWVSMTQVKLQNSKLGVQGFSYHNRHLSNNFISQACSESKTTQD